MPIAIHMKRIVAATAIVMLCVTTNLFAAQTDVLIREEFNTLDKWKPLHFPKIPNHSSYTVDSDGPTTCLKAESNNSASGIICKSTFNVYDYPRIRWRWKVSNIYNEGNAQKKKGDDYPIRIYVVFQYDPKKAGLLDRTKYNAAKRTYGEYPPHSTLNYIWANRDHKSSIITNAYSKNSKMIVLQKGRANLGKWIPEEVHILRDYRKAFGKSAPPVASIAIMNDSDNTGEKSVSYVDFIEVYK